MVVTANRGLSNPYLDGSPFWHLRRPGTPLFLSFGRLLERLSAKKLKQ
jgi:hypothetical protein